MALNSAFDSWQRVHRDLVARESALELAETAFVFGMGPEPLHLRRDVHELRVASGKLLASAIDVLLVASTAGVRCPSTP